MTDILDTVESVVGRVFCADCRNCADEDIAQRCDEYKKALVAARLAAAQCLGLALNEDYVWKVAAMMRDNIVMLRRGCEAICGKCARPWDKNSGNKVCPQCGGRIVEVL